MECSDFINYITDKIKNNLWFLDAFVGKAVSIGKFEHSQMVCTKTLYNYIDLGFLSIKNVDLPMKLRKNTKTTRINKHRKKLGRSIAERLIDISNRTEFGHWEIDTVIGEKPNNDCILLTIVDRKTRYAMALNIADKTATAVMDALGGIRDTFQGHFSQAFKTITGDNCSEFADLSIIEKEADTKIYFTHLYSSFEKGTNERHNNLIRRFIPKGKRISDYDSEDISFIEDWMNSLPRRILKYKTPEELFEIHT